MSLVRELLSKIRTWLDADAEQLTTLALLGVGLVLRARGFVLGTVPLWEDEAAWAMRLVDLPLSEHTIRPLGFMALSKLLALHVSASETALRALPWLSGAACLALAPALARRLFTSPASRLLFVAILALSPPAIDLAKEFKPYSVSLALHTGSLLLSLRYVASQRARELWLLLGLSCLGTLFAQDLLFTYPGVFALLLVEARRARRGRHALAVVGAALATLAVVVVNYVCFWSKAVREGDGTVDYWGKKYDVFCVAGSHWVWTAEKLGDMFALPGMRRESWASHRLDPATLAELRIIDSQVWQALVVVGIGLLVLHRRPRVLVLLVGPLAWAVLFNALGRWPLGAFRTNLFGLVYVAALAAAALDRRQPAPRGWDFVPMAALVLLPYLWLDPDNHAKKGSMANGSAFTSVLSALGERKQRGRADSRPLLLMDGASCAPWKYYTGYHPRRKVWARIGRRFDVHCAKNFPGIVNAARKGTRQGTKIFVLLTSRRALGLLEASRDRELRIESARYFGDRDHLLLTLEPDSDR